MKKLSLWHFYLSKILMLAYFSKISVHGKQSKHPTLYIVSHRNGATDGQVYTFALGRVPSLISIQLLRKWFLALMFDGIPVIRPKDAEKFKLPKNSIQSPTEAAIEQIKLGGSICVMPEGTSEWGYKPEAYQLGMAKIIAELQEQKIDCVVQALGIFYTKPNGFRSRVSVVFGEVFEPLKASQQEIFLELSQQLDHVSVNCSSIEQFNTVQALAWHDLNKQHKDYGQTFLTKQNMQLKHSELLENQLENQLEIHKNQFYKIQLKIAQLFLWIGAFPTLLFALIAEKKGADGKNNVTFFRILGGFYGSIFTVLYWCILAFWSLKLLSVLIVLTIVGWYFYPEPYPEKL